MDSVSFTQTGTGEEEKTFKVKEESSWGCGTSIDRDGIQNIREHKNLGMDKIAKESR